MVWYTLYNIIMHIVFIGTNKTYFLNCVYSDVIKKK